MRGAYYYEKNVPQGFFVDCIRCGLRNHDLSSNIMAYKNSCRCSNHSRYTLL